MTDPFARRTAKHAHDRVNRLTYELKTLAKRVPKRAPMFIGHCSLCGHVCKPNRRYCHAHSWAEGID